MLLLYYIWCLGFLTRSKGRREWLKKYQPLNWYTEERGLRRWWEKGQVEESWAVAMGTGGCSLLSRGGFPVSCDPRWGVRMAAHLCFSLWTTWPCLFPFYMLETRHVRSWKPHSALVPPRTLRGFTSPDGTNRPWWWWWWLYLKNCKSQKQLEVVC